MKKIFLILFCLSLGTINAQRKPKIKGNKSVVEINESLEYFYKIQLDDDLDINLERSEEPGYTVTADDNLVDVLKFKVKDSTLIISAFYKITGKKELDIVVRFSQLGTIIMNEGFISSDETIATDEMILEFRGNSGADLRLSNEITSLRMNDNSKVQLNIEADSIAVIMNDKSMADIYAMSTGQSIRIEDNASANLEGMAETLQMNVMGNSRLKAESFQCERASLDLAETSTSRITINEHLELSMSETAKLYLYGNPQIDLRQFLDNSELYKRAE